MPPSGNTLRVARYGAIGFELTGTIAAGALVGWFLDSRLGTGPYLTLVFLLLAIVGGFVRLIQTLQQLDRIERRPDEP